ncbi:hypothetical protein NVSP9465_04387 [Novosphingobium sp. CECT 9465]|nr:hypothetical protein NVSP9465_04387 [Novosphingobium sp. CECT 9465]
MSSAINRTWRDRHMRGNPAHCSVEKDSKMAQKGDCRPASRPRERRSVSRPGLRFSGCRQCQSRIRRDERFLQAPWPGGKSRSRVRQSRARQWRSEAQDIDPAVPPTADGVERHPHRSRTVRPGRTHGTRPASSSDSIPSVISAIDIAGSREPCRAVRLSIARPFATGGSHSLSLHPVTAARSWPLALGRCGVEPR